MMYCFINSNLNLLLALAVIAGNLLLLVAALYFAAEALRSQSKAVVAYLSGRADALEEVRKGFQEKLLIGGQPSCRNMQNQKLLSMWIADSHVSEWPAKWPIIWLAQRLVNWRTK